MNDPGMGLSPGTASCGGVMGGCSGKGKSFGEYPAAYGDGGVGFCARSGDNDVDPVAARDVSAACAAVRGGTGGGGGVAALELESEFSPWLSLTARRRKGTLLLLRRDSDGRSETELELASPVPSLDLAPPELPAVVRPVGCDFAEDLVVIHVGRLGSLDAEELRAARDDRGVAMLARTGERGEAARPRSFRSESSDFRPGFSKSNLGSNEKDDIGS